MANYLSEIKLPSGDTYKLKDSEKTDEKVKQTANTEDKEFPIILKNTNNTTNETNGVKYAGGVTVNPSEKTVTATEFIGNIKANRVQPTVVKNWTSTSFYGANISGQDVHDLSTFWMLSVKPDSWYEPWVVRFKITTTCPAAANYYSVTYCMYSGRADGIVVFNWNERYDHAHYYTNIRTLKKAGFDAGLGHAIGINLYASNNYTNANYYRSFKLEYYDCDNCTVTILDTPVKWANWSNGTTTNYNGNNNANAVDRGLQESGDANSYDLLQMSNNYIKNGAFRFPGISMFGYDREGHAQAFSLYQSGYTSYTASASNKETRIYNTNGIDWTRGIHYNASGGSWAENADMNITTRLAQSAVDLRYTDNCVSTAGTTISMVTRKAVYIRGTLDDNGLFHVAPMDVSYNGGTYCRTWTQDIPTQVDNYVYWFIGYPYYTSPYQVNLYVENPLYWFHNGHFEEYNPPVVEQIGTSEAKDYPILLKYTNDTDNEINYTKYSNNVTADATATKPFTFNPSTGNLTVTQLKIGTKNDNMGLFPNLNNWNQIGSGSLYWYRAYINNYYGGRSHVDNWDSGKNIGTAATSSAAAVLGTVNFYNTAAAGATQTKTLLTADSTTNSNITITLPKTTGTLALKSELPTLSGLGGIGTISASGTAPLTLSGSKSGTTYTLTGSIADASASASGIINTDAQTFAGRKTFKYTTRIYPQIGATGEKSKWYKITFPYYDATTSSSAKWFMNSFDLHFGGGYQNNPSGVAYVTFYWTRAANNGAWTLGQGAAHIEGILANKIIFYYRVAEPGILYVCNSANAYNGIWLDNLYVDDTSPSLDWSTTKIETTSAITANTNPALSAYTVLPATYLYNDADTLKTDSNFEGKYIKGTWLYTSAATAKTSTTKLATIESDNFIYYITPANALKSAIGTTAIGAEKTPIYWNGSGFSAGTVLKNLAYKDSLTASDIPDISDTYIKKISSTDEAIVRFNGTDGTVQNSNITINDNGTMSFPTEQDINFRMNRKNASGGGWAHSYIKWYDQSDTIFANIGIYGQNNTFDHLYIGSNTSYSSDLNLQIYNDGTIKGKLFSGSGASLTSLNGSNISSGTVALARLPMGNANTALMGKGSSTAPAYVSVSPSISITDGTADNAPKVNLTVLGVSGTTAQELTKATTGVYGATKLSNAIDSSSEVLAATPKAVKAAYDQATTALNTANNLLATADALVFKGTLGTGGTITTVPTGASGKEYQAGYTYKIITDGTYAGNVCEAGDLLIAIADSTSGQTTVNNAHWTVVQSNLERYIHYYNNHDNDIDSLIATPYLQTAAANGGNWSGTKPSGSHNGVALFNFQTHHGNYYTQLALDTSQNRLWLRSANNATAFGAWSKIATVADIEALDVSNISGFGTTKTLKTLTQADGKIAATFQDITFPVTSVAGKTGAVTLAKGDVGLGNVDNTADANKSVNYATSAGSATTAAYLSTPSITTEENIESGTRAYQGSGSGWTGSVTSMTYAGILQVCGGYSRGWQIWATRGDNATQSLHWRNPNGAANAWNEERIILDSGNYTDHTVTKTGTGASGTWGISITGSSASCTGNAATATAIQTAGTTAQFYRGDNSWSNIIKQTAASALGIDTNRKIGTAIKDLHFTVGSGSGTGINDGNAGGITIGTDTASYGGIYWQSSGSYGLRLHFATTGSFANGAYTRMLITHDGKVGIGTLTPDTLLTVNGNAKADKFIGALQGNADTATTATNLSAKPSLAASNNNITVTAGGKTSDAFTVPYATSANTATTATWVGKGTHTAAITANEFTPAVGTMTILGNVSNTTMTHTNNANAEMIIKAHPSSGTSYYEARLGFSSNGKLYYMPVNTSDWTTIAYISDIPTNLNQLTNGPGYVTSSGVTSVKLIQGAGITVSSSGTAITTTGERTISITGMDTTNGSTTKWLDQKGNWSTPTAANVGALASTTKYAASSSVGGAATNATTTANTSDSIYPVGVKSGATTTLLHDTSITMKGNAITAVTYNSTAASLTSETSTTANTAKYATLTLGNNANVNSTTAHSEGQIVMYSAATQAHTIKGTSTTTAYTHTLPNDTGLLVSLSGGTAKGSSTKPVYIPNTGIVTECSTYAGGTKVTFNGADKGASAASFYAPTGGGTAGNVLISAGTSAPAWYGGAAMTGTAAASWKTAFNGTTDATASNAAAVTIAGGLGIAKSIIVGETATITDDTRSPKFTLTVNDADKAYLQYNTTDSSIDFIFV